ncbi:MAG: hypothetical protein K0V04_11580 [Deltaproteobacteria bacterium]|nr:hypothetical protein [Deltaproteobacteria bacterium]
MLEINTTPLVSMTTIAPLLLAGLTACAGSDQSGTLPDDGTGDSSTGGSNVGDEMGETTAIEPHAADSTTDEPDATDGPNTTDEGDMPVCGNGMVEPGEVCDDGINDNVYGGCAEDCTAMAGHCGDGIAQLDAGEACDDGDGLEGNGCNTDCVVSGSLRWSIDYATARQEANLGLAVAIAPGQMPIVSAASFPSFVADVRRFSPEGEHQWTFPLEGEAPRPWSVAASNANAIAIAGFGGDGGWVIGTSSAGAPTWSDPVDSGPVYDVSALADGGFVAVGSTEEVAMVHRYSADGQLLWSTELEETPRVRAVAGGHAGGFVVLGAIGPDDALWAQGFTGPQESEPTWLSVLPDLLDPTEIDVADDGTVVVSGAASGQMWVSSLSSAGNEQWTRTFAPGGEQAGASGHGVAAAQDGGVFVVGMQHETPERFDMLVRRYSAAGELDWAQAIESPYVDDGFFQANDAAVDFYGDLVVVGTVATGVVPHVWLGKFAP